MRIQLTLSMAASFWTLALGFQSSLWHGTPSLSLDSPAVCRRPWATTPSPAALAMASSSEAATKSSSNNKVDIDALSKYLVALATQMGLFYGLFTLLDKLVAAFHYKVPSVLNFLFFYSLALKSRILNPLSNQRPQPRNLEVEDDAPKRVMPKFTPPGVVFPIMWLLIIAPLRAVSSTMVYNTVGRYANKAILALMLHLSIGDIWNTINNTERRYGMSVTGVVCVWLSKAYAAYQYWLVNKTAGQLLSLTLIWLSIASVLITQTWRLNPDPVTGQVEPLYPVEGKTKTQYVWFASEDDENEVKEKKKDE